MWLNNDDKPECRLSVCLWFERLGISDLVWLRGYGILVVSKEVHALEGQEDKTVPKEAFRLMLVNERFKLLPFGLHD